MKVFCGCLGISNVEKRKENKVFSWSGDRFLVILHPEIVAEASVFIKAITDLMH